MTAPAAFTPADRDGTLRFTGTLALASIGDLPDRLHTYEGAVDRLDMSGIDHIDTVGAWLVHRFATEHDAEITGLDADGRYLLEQVSAADEPVAARAPPPTHFIRVLGEIAAAVVVSLTPLYGLLGSLVATAIACGNVLRAPRRFSFMAPGIRV